MTTVIDALIARNEDILRYLRDSGEYSLAMEHEANFTKLLIMACGSFFETDLCDSLETFVITTCDPRAAEWIKIKGIRRHYHTMFDWNDKRSCNKFLALFGDEFKVRVAREIKDSEIYRQGLLDFITLGDERNILAHGNLVALPNQRTLVEVRSMYASAFSFMYFLKEKFVSQENVVGPGERAVNLRSPEPQPG